MLGDGPDGGRQEDVLASLDAREAFVPADGFGAGCGDDVVGPGHLEAAQSDGGEHGDQGTHGGHGPAGREEVD